MQRSLLLCLAACTYNAPDNPYAPDTPNVITGTVSVSDVEFTMPVMVLLTDAANPMPPSGTGSPVTFTTVPGSAFSTNTMGTRSAPWALTNVPDGRWVVTAVMDLDRNFHPSVPTLAGATCGDVIGLHPASLGSRELGVVEVSGGQLLRDIPVLLGVSVPTSRPAFMVSASGDTIDPTTPLGVFRLESVPVSATYGPNLRMNVSGPFEPSAPDPCHAAFWVHPKDEDGDGLPDPHPAYPPELGVADVWPRVFIEWLGVPVDTTGDAEVDSFDRGSRGATRYLSEGLPWFPQLFGGDPADDALIGRTFPTTVLDVAFAGSFQQIDPDGTRTVVTDPTLAPEGAWRVTVISESGQTWTVPNELDTSLQLSRLPPPGVTSDRDARQGTWLTLRGE